MKANIILLFLIVYLSAYAEDKKPNIKYGAESVYQSIPVKVDINLRDLPLVPQWQPGDPIREIPRRYIPRAGLNANPQRPTFPEAYNDSLLKIQRDYDLKEPAISSRAFNTTIIAQDGANNTGVSPPDTVGDVGISYYIHSYNGSGGALYRIYDKATGNLVAGPLAMDTITPTTGNCSGGNGDPIVLFDEMAGRWMISEFTASGNAMCVYISQTGDPIAGGWFVYEFIGASFPDYPKYGVWSDAYYIGTNENSTSLYALDRTQMLAGNPATMQRFTTADLSGFGFQMLVPADHDGATAPKAGAPGMFMRHNDDEVHVSSCGGTPSQDCLQLWDFNVDWVTPGNSSITGPVNILINNFDSDLCGLSSFACMTQPGTGNTLDPLREVILWRLQYRNFGTHETLVANLETDVTGTDQGGIRWFELRRTTGTTASDWSLFQEGTWAPDSTNRWMGSASMDSSGNIALAYSTSSATAGDFPSLKYAGRLATDPINVLTTGESTIVSGSAAQTSNTRWGDYAAMSVDPVDGCTFWFSSEYTPTSAWRTHLSSFKFDSCGAPSYTLAVAPKNIEVCVNPSPATAPDVTVSTTSLLGFSSPISLGFNPALPTGFSSSFTLNPVTPGGSSVLTLTVDNTATAGINTITVEGTAAGINKQDSFDVLVSFPVSTTPTLNSPFNGESNVSTSPTFSWSVINGASDYDIDIATDAAFVNIIETATVQTNSHTAATTLNTNTQYYWRVRAKNSCGIGNYASASFTTANLVSVTVCSTPAVAIPDDNAAGIDDTLTFVQDITITDIDTTINASHSWVGDLIFTLTNDGTGTSAIIIDRPGVPASGSGCANNDINTTIDDDNGTPVENECNATPPAIAAGPFTPNNPLTVFDGEAAMNNWTLNVSDNVGQDTGTLNEWCVVVTGTPVVVQPDISFTGTNLSQDVCLDPGPTAITPVSLNVTAINGYNSPVTLGFNPVLPTGITGGFSVNPLNPVPAPGAQSILNLTVDNTATIGTNVVTVDASGAGIATKSLNVNLNVVLGLTAAPSLTVPADGNIGVATNTVFSWAAISGAISYDIDISRDPTFASIDFTANVATTSYTPASALLSGTFYYWRVRAVNVCGSTSFTTAAFETIGSNGTTTSTTCNSTVTTITDDFADGVNSVLSIAPGGIITDIDILLDVTHTYVGDLIATVTNDSTGTNAIVMDRPGVPASTFGCSGNNINTTLDDAAAIAVEGICASGVPTIGAGPFSPNNPLSVFDTESSAGTWTLNISDNVGADTGTLNQWCVVATIDSGSTVGPADYSDLASSYGVAKHEGGGTSKLGTNWTADTVFSQDSDAADDDGITASGMWLPNSTTAQLSVTSNGGYLACWFDWNNDGAFTGAEQSIAQNIATGVVNIAVTIPLSSTFGSNGDDFLESRCRFYFSEPLRATETASGLATSGEVEDYRFAANQLTPITLAYTNSSLRNASFSLDWSTTTEAGTIGFNVYGFEHGIWKIINQKPIQAKGINSVTPHDYHLQVDSSQFQLYKIEELTAHGLKHQYGAFVSGQAYGRYPSTQQINWQQIKAISDEKKRQRQENRKGSFDFIKINVDQEGIQRISYQQLLALGVDWQGVSANEISISLNNQPISRYVSANTFAAGEYIEFVGQALDTLYTKTNVYKLSLNPALAKPAKAIDATALNIDTNAYHMATIKIDDDQQYSFASPSASPWFKQSLLVFTDENSWQFQLPALNLLDNGVNANFSYKAWGGTDWPDQAIDHHLQILLNNQQIADVFANGLELLSDNIGIANTQLVADNTVTVKMPADTGVDFDLIQLDQLSLTYPSTLQVNAAALKFVPILSQADTDIIHKNGFEANTIESGFVVNGFTTQDIHRYAYDGVNLYHFPAASTQANGTEYALELPYISGNNISYYVAQDNQVINPVLELGTNSADILAGQFDYLMITHADFRQTLAQLVTYHQAQGTRVKVVDVNDIYANYADNHIDANAIKAYIKDANAQMGISAVLLVGSDSYDYLDNLNIGSISYVPTLYFPTDENIRYAPVDSLYSDINNDLIPDLMMGRLPVRSELELQNIIDKINQFDARNYPGTAIFASDRDASFDLFSDQMIELMPQSWQIDKAYMSQLDLAGAQSTLISRIDSGVSLTSFFGHSGPSTWSFEHLFDNSNILALNNINKPTLINQFGCWNTYYVMPQFNTMAHYFMQLEAKGAVAVMGASTLTESFHESELGYLLIPALAQNNTSIGQAILTAKQNLASTHPEYLDVILGWTLLGDPLIQVNQ